MLSSISAQICGYSICSVTMVDEVERFVYQCGSETAKPHMDPVQESNICNTAYNTGLLSPYHLRPELLYPPLQLHYPNTVSLHSAFLATETSPPTLSRKMWQRWYIITHSRCYILFVSLQYNPNVVMLISPSSWRWTVYQIYSMYYSIIYFCIIVVRPESAFISGYRDHLVSLSALNVFI